MSSAQVLTARGEFQKKALACAADILIMGGGAGGGKTVALLADGGRWVKHANYTAMLFRRTTPMLRAPGSMWDESRWFAHLGGVKREQTLEWRFPSSGAVVAFRHLEYEKDKDAYQGAQAAFLGFDELTHFLESQVTYLLSRNRLPSGCTGIRPYMRAGCNPDADSWVRDWVAPWVLPSHELYPTKYGEILWFVRYADEGEIPDVVRPFILAQNRDYPLEMNGAADMVWISSEGAEVLNTKAKADAAEGRAPEVVPTSITYIPSLGIHPESVKKDPGYVAKLHALPKVDRVRLLGEHPECWLIRHEGGGIFDRDWFRLLDVAPHCVELVRVWDFAATDKQKSGGKAPDFTAGVKMGRTLSGELVILDVKTIRGLPGDVEQLILATSRADGPSTRVYIEEERGAAGKHLVHHYRQALPAHNVERWPMTGDKLSRAKPLSMAAQAGRVSVVRGPWLGDLLTQAERFPGGGYDDAIDAACGACSALEAQPVGGAGVSIGNNRDSGQGWRDDVW